MATLVYDCPHCGANNIGFSVREQFNCLYNRINAVAVGATCNACSGPSLAVIRIRMGISPIEYPGNILANDMQFEFLAFFPEVPESESPADVPGPVERAFNQAAGSRKSGHFDAACAMYRKAMELALKAFSPDIEAWKIEKRIDRMAAEHRITPELQTWAHELRLDGNEAVHGEDEATQEVADQMHELCKFLLIYLYTLPAQVERAKVRRAED